MEITVEGAVAVVAVPAAALVHAPDPVLAAAGGLAVDHVVAAAPSRALSPALPNLAAHPGLVQGVAADQNQKASHRLPMVIRPTGRITNHD